MEQPPWNFEQAHSDKPLDETGINLRAYFDRMDDGKMQQYSPGWSDEQLMEWDDNFKDDGTVMLGCSERDIDVEEYRRALEQSIAYRNRVRPQLVKTS